MMMIIMMHEECMHIDDYDDTCILMMMLDEYMYIDDDA